jgi:adenylyltransferase/sulfurtransferase
VFVAGIGGLGSISSSYLAAAGVGHIRIVDCDMVEISNLNRQILHWSRDIGRAKTESAMEKLSELNPDCDIEAVFCRIDMASAPDLVGDCDVILDATDNLAARKALNGASVRLKIPFVHGAVGGLNGMVTTFLPGMGPCLECLFPLDDVAVKVGILGPTAGIIASIQAMETIKLIVGSGGTLMGRLLYLYGSDMRWKEIKVASNPLCGVCGKTH